MTFPTYRPWGSRMGQGVLIAWLLSGQGHDLTIVVVGVLTATVFITLVDDICQQWHRQRVDAYQRAQIEKWMQENKKDK